MSRFLCKSIMNFTPEFLLSSASRERCLTNLKDIPILILDIEQKVNASVLVPLCIDKGEVCLLYTMRSMQLKNHSGQISFPGGKMDEGETVYETALRETEEEIGFPREEVEIWAKMREVQGRNKNIVVMPVIGFLKDFSMERLKANEDEVAEIFTIPIKTLCDSNNHAHLPYENIMTPIFLGGKHKVWGITGIITHMFLQSLVPSHLYDIGFLNKKFKFDDLLPSKI